MGSDLEKEPEQQQDAASPSDYIIIRLFIRFKNWFEWKYPLRLGIAVVGMALLVLLFDQIILPIYTKHGEEVILPNVEFEMVEDANKILEQNGFRPILDHENFSKSLPKGTVLTQNPAPGTTVKTGRRVYLVVSKGEKWIGVPDLIGQSERNAEAILRRSELVPGQLEYEFSTMYPKNVVIGQSIMSGDSVTIGDTVRFVISLGDIPEFLAAPQLTGKSFREARKILVRSGFQLGIIIYRVNEDLLPETILGQSIPADSLIDPSTPIDLIVSRIEDQEELEN